MRGSLLIATVLAGCAASSSQALSPVTGRSVPGLVVVDWVDGTTKAQFDAIERDFGLDLEFNSVASEEAALTIAQAQPTPELLARLRAHPLVEAAEPALVMQTFFVPDDPDYARQWHLAMVGSEKAWEWSTGRDVVVAVIDTGISQVDDLAGSAFVRGWDFVDDDDDPSDENGHGTHVAGTVAQSTHNGRGVAGLAHAAALMPVRVLDRHGSGHTADIADGIRWAVKHGAKVINLSLGGYARSAVLEDAVRDAVDAGVVVVAAAGNGFGPPVAFPAAYEGAIAVSSVRFDRQLAPYSSYGPGTTLAAPGGDKNVDQNGDGQPDGVLQQIPGGRYEWYQGTSMASPHVAGAAALLASAGVTRGEAIRDLLVSTAKPAGEKERFGAGTLDAGAAVTRVRLGGGLFRGLLALVFLWLARLVVRRRETSVRSLGLLGLIGIVAASSGLMVPSLAGFGHSTLGALLSSPLPEWGRALHGATQSSPLWLSAAVPFAAFFVGRWRPLAGVAAGLCLGWAGYLAHEAVVGWTDIAWVPGRSLEMGWLLAHALLATMFAAFTLRPESR